MNRWNFIIGFVVLLVLIIIFLYLVKNKIPDYIKKKYESFRQTAAYYKDKLITPVDKLYENTVGHIYDDTVDLALQKGRNINFRYHTRAPTNPHEVAQSIRVPFILGDLYNYNMQQPETAQHYYNLAIARANMNADTWDTWVNEVPVETIRDRTRTIPDLNQMRFPGSARDLMRTKPEAKPELKSPIFPDPQNVHDSLLNFDMQNRYHAIVEKNNNDPPVNTSEMIENFIKRINKEKFDEDLIINSDLQTRYSKTLQNINHDTENTFDALNNSPANILNNIVRRIYSPENSRARPELENAFVDCLRNTVTTGAYGKHYSVCTSGKINNLMNTFTLLDADPEIAKPIITAQIARADIYDRINTQIRAWLDSNPGFRPFYETGTGPEPADYRAKLNEKKAQIRTQIMDSLPAADPDFTNNSKLMTYLNEGLDAVD